jgi:serine/threonine-protein kinase HipA
MTANEDRVAIDVVRDRVYVGSINEVETACDVSIAMDARKDYGLTAQQADSALRQVQAAVRGWRSEANRLHIPKAEQDLTASAFAP